MTRPQLDARSVTVSFDGHRVLDNVDFTVAAGTVTGVTGPSGSGKTTLLRILAGLLRPDSGVVRYAGSRTVAPGSIAVLAQHPRLVCNPRWTLGQIVAEPAVIRREAIEVSELASRVGLDGSLLDRYPGQVSNGQLQRACVARILAQPASYVLCDEPTAMLDPIATADVVRLLRSIADAQAAMVLVSHDPAVIAALSQTTVAL